MKVLFNTYPVAFDCPGGGEIQLLRTKEALEKSGVEVKLFDIWNPQLNGVDIVHYFSAQGGSIPFCAYVKKRGLPLVISPILWLGDDPQKRYPIEEIRALFDLCDLILPNSKAEAEQLSGFFGIPRKKFHITRNGVDRSFAAAINTDIFNKRCHISRPFVLNVANIEERKNQINLIRALKGTALELVIAGNIRDRAYFEKCMQQGKGLVKYLGYIDHGSAFLKSAYRACELFVLPSLLETPGLSALEAGAAGSKIVITEVGCAREYFGDMVTYVNPLDAGDIRRGILEEMAKKRGGGLKKQIIKNFLWDKTARQVREAYSRVLKKRRGT